MINKKIVFILGAGASKPYGFPTGAELKKEVLQKNYGKGIKAAKSRQQGQYSSLWAYILDTCGEQIVESFFKSLRKSGFSSVDAFLENREEFIELGKILISIELIKYEDENKLYSCEAGDWYQYLYHNMLRASSEDFSRNNISFLTFNYDRSLEHFLINALSNDYGISNEQAAAYTKSIPIVHLHGMLGNLPSMSEENSRDYNSVLTPENLEICKNSIKIIHEGIDDDEEFQLAHKLLSEAEQVWFLGFGYDNTNLVRLRLPEIIQNGTTVLGTTFRLRMGEVIRNVSTPFKGKFNFDEYKLKKSDLDSLEYLKEYAQLII